MKMALGKISRISKFFVEKYAKTLDLFSLQEGSPILFKLSALMYIITAATDLFLKDHEKYFHLVTQTL
jgi:hypothetical protein